MKKIVIVSLLLSAFVLISCTDKQTKKEIRNHQNAAATFEYVKNESKKYDDKIQNYISKLSLEEKISQLFIENLEGCTSFRSYETVGAMNGTDDKTPLVAGGYIFFGKNICDTKEEMQAFNQTIYDYCAENNVIPPYLAVNMWKRTA